jgi:hypothetical protein
MLGAAQRSIRVEAKRRGHPVRGIIEQGWANRLKIIKAAVRLEYSILADNELNRRLDEERTKYFKQVQQGKLPKALAAKNLIDD